MEHISERIRELRGSASQREFAERIGINMNTLRAYEKGRSFPSSEVLANICSFFDASPAWLLLGEGPMLKAEKLTRELPQNQGKFVGDIEKPTIDSQRSFELEAELKEERRELRETTQELRKALAENSRLLKENGDLRVEIAELKAIAASAAPCEADRRSA